MAPSQPTARSDLARKSRVSRAREAPGFDIEAPSPTLELGGDVTAFQSSRGVWGRDGGGGGGGGGGEKRLEKERERNSELYYSRIKILGEREREID